MNLAEMCSGVERLSREVGAFIQEQRNSSVEIELKGLNNLVSRVDKNAETKFVEGLSKLLPEAGFIAEEGSATHNNEEFLWVIDPLDGTTNYLHGIPAYCTSVALLQDRKPVIGVIYDPNQDEMFAATAESEATMNGQPIRVTQRDLLQKSVLATGFPYDNLERQNQYIELFGELC
ncbi:MAG: inositol monophosphatase, partial [Flavobacteriales bacterium]|nr:inositol monophosphatase [Flavobacteriales bacterium]